MRRRGLHFAGLVALLALVFAGWVFAASEARLERRYRVRVAELAPPAGGDSLQRGRHLVTAVAQCTTCHAEDLGGAPIADDFWLGRLSAPNLTPGRGGIAARSDAALVRSIRHGLAPDGRPLLMMPSHYLQRLSDADVSAIIATLRASAPVDRELPTTRVGPLTRLALFLGRAPDLIPAELIDHERAGGLPATPEASARYGAYLVETGGCRICHRDDLAGGLHPLSLPGEPPPPNLTAGGAIAGWSEADFVRALRTGVAADGRQLDANFMPWPTIARMSDLELRAIWLYLRSLPRVPSRA